MTALYGPQTANAVTEKPSDNGTQRYGALQTWFQNCSGPGATDGTVPDATFYNRIVGALDYLVGQSGVSALPGDDSALYRAIIQVFEGAAPTALNSLQELATALGNDPNFSGTIMTMLGNRLRFDAGQTLTPTQKLQAVANLALAAVAVSGNYSDLSGKPSLGSAAALNVGTSAGQVVQLDGNAKLPVVDGSQLTNVGKAVNQSVSLANATDFNTLVTDGTYYNTGACPNTPVAASLYYLFVQGYTSGYVAQRAVQFSNADTYQRVNYNGTWSAWRKILTLDMAGTAAGSIVQLDGTGRLPAVDGSQLTNVTAANSNANALKNYIVNGGMQVSQRYGTTAGTSTGFYPADQWSVTFANAPVSSAQLALATPGGSSHRIRVSVTAAHATVAAGDYLAINQYIEGSRVADLKMGTAAPKSITVAIGVRGPAGTYGMALRNQALNRSSIQTFTIAAGEAGSDVVKTVTFTGDTAGTWLAGVGQTGLILTVALMAGTTYQGTAGAFAAVNAISTSSQFNLTGTSGNTFDLFDVGVFAGNIAPTFQLPHYEGQFLLAQRYWRSTYTYGTPPGTAVLDGMDQLAIGVSGNYGSSGKGFQYPSMCKIPIVTAYSPNSGAVNKMFDFAGNGDVTPNIVNPNTTGFRWVAPQYSTPQVFSIGGHFVMDATLN